MKPSALSADELEHFWRHTSQEDCLCRAIYRRASVCRRRSALPERPHLKMSIAELNKELEKAFSPGEGGDGDPIALVCYRFS